MMNSFDIKSKQILFRPLQPADYYRGLWNLLAQLTKVSEPTYQHFVEYLSKMNQNSSKHINIVALNIQKGELVGFGSIIICSTLNGKVGKIQNIVTSKIVRGKGYGKLIIQKLKEEGWKNKCTSITLFCEDKNVEFYKKLGFHLQGDIYAHYKS